MVVNGRKIQQFKKFILNSKWRSEQCEKGLGTENKYNAHFDITLILHFNYKNLITGYYLFFISYIFL